MTLFILTNGIQAGFRRTLPVLFGASTSYFLAILIFAIGLSNILQKNLIILKLFQLAGVLYILYLSYCQWTRTDTFAKVQSGSENLHPLYLYKKGFLIAFSNPKTILLFSIVFPQFVRTSENRSYDMLILGIIFLVLQFSSGCFYSYFGERIHYLLKNPIYQNLLNKLCAIILLLVALMLGRVF